MLPDDSLFCQFCGGIITPEKDPEKPLVKMVSLRRCIALCAGVSLVLSLVVGVAVGNTYWAKSSSAYSEGYGAGYAEGEDAGYTVGYPAGKIKGYVEGYKQGKGVRNSTEYSRGWYDGVEANKNYYMDVGMDIQMCYERLTDKKEPRYWYDIDQHWVRDVYLELYQLSIEEQKAKLKEWGYKTSDINQMVKVINFMN
jgi:hypothetical protein